DASVLCRLLEENGLIALACQDVGQITQRLPEGAGSVLLTEEALTSQAAVDLSQALTAQPSWSDLPVLLLAGSERLMLERVGTVANLRGSGNLTVLQRPARALTLVTSVQAALRARRRQYQVRDLVESERA